MSLFFEIVHEINLYGELGLLYKNMDFSLCGDVIMKAEKYLFLHSFVKNVIDVPLIVGGGIKTPEVAERAVRAGASIIVTGTIIENDLNLTKELADAVHCRK